MKRSIIATNSGKIYNICDDYYDYNDYYGYCSDDSGTYETGDEFVGFFDRSPIAIFRKNIEENNRAVEF